MKLSKTGWNNVIIISVMLIILFINATNNKLFPDENSQENNSTEQLLLPQHSVILTLKIQQTEQQFILFERTGKNWQVSNEIGLISSYNNQKIEQMAFSWQQSQGLVQADDIVISGNAGIDVIIELANNEQVQRFVLYPLNDQLLILNKQKNQWLALPSMLSKQLLPLFKNIL